VTTTGSSADVWRTWPRERLEREYSPSSCIASIDPYLERYAERSRQALASLEVRRDLRYGAGPDETLDFFPAPHPGAPLHVFFHGGYWQELAKRDSLYPALGLVPNGVSFAAVEYTLAPAASVGGIVDQARRSVAWLARDAAALGVDRRRILVSGHSAGAHLAAMVMLTDWEAQFGLPPDTVVGGVLVSGVYDLEPLLATYVNDALGLDVATARALSPARLLPVERPSRMPTAPEPRLPVMLRRGPAPAVALPAVVAWGEIETAEFERQSLEFASGWAALGHPVDVFEVPGRNHFDVILELADPGTQLGAAAYRLLGLRCG
jgi:arylformamidase